MPLTQPFYRRALTASTVVFLVVLLLAGAASLTFPAQQPGGQPAFTLFSTVFSEHGFIPSRYTCSGQNVSPYLRWSAPPKGTVAYALTVTDPDAPSHTWVHWVAYNIPGAERELSGGVAKGNQIHTGGVQGLNDFHDVGYGGPCPPPGKPHRYFFTLYALNARLPLRPGATRRQVEQAMKGHVLAQATLIGMYGR